MSQRLRLNVDAVNDEIRDRTPGARIEVQRDTTSAFAAPTGIGTVTLVQDQSQYEFFDSTGTNAHWYRFRLTNNAGLLPSDWSAVFRGSAPQAYATLDALREELGIPNDTKDNLLSDLLVEATAYINAECHRDFFRHPAVDGEEVRTFMGLGTRMIEIPPGFVSISAVRGAYQTNGTYSNIASTDYVFGPFNKRDDMSYDELWLHESSTWPKWYIGWNTVEVTGVFGWESIPTMVSKACLDLAREMYRQGPGGGGPVGINQFGTPIFGGGLPLSVRRVITNFGYNIYPVR